MMETWLPRKLRLLRVRQGLTLVEAAKKTGVTRVTLSELERGHREPVAPTLVKIAEGYGVPIEDLLEEPALSGKAEAPEETEPSSGLAAEGEQGQRSLPYIIAWSTFIEELAGDIEEWRYAKLGEVSDPADLPEDDFLLFTRGAIPFVQTYRRVNETIYADGGLLSLLQVEVRLWGKGREIEHFEQAFRRLSRVMLSVVTEGVEQRIALLEASSAEAEPEPEEAAVASSSAQSEEGPYLSSGPVREKLRGELIEAAPRFLKAREEAKAA